MPMTPCRRFRPPAHCDVLGKLPELPLPQIHTDEYRFKITPRPRLMRDSIVIPPRNELRDNGTLTRFSKCP